MCDSNLFFLSSDRTSVCQTAPAGSVCWAGKDGGAPGFLEVTAHLWLPLPEPFHLPTLLSSALQMFHGRQGMFCPWPSPLRRDSCAALAARSPWGEAEHLCLKSACAVHEPVPRCLEVFEGPNHFVELARIAMISTQVP